MEQKNIIFTLVVAFIILIGGTLIYAAKNDSGLAEDVALADKVKGNPEAEVVLEEYSDFQCPACASFVPILEEVAEKYGDKLRIEFHHYPLIQIHPNAVLSAQAAEAAGIQGKFWEMHDVLFERQAAWSSSVNPRSTFVAYAEELGLNTEQFESQINSNAIREVVQSDLREARTQGMTGTPTFLLNGEKMTIASFDDFMKQIEVAIGIAEPEAGAPVSATEVEFGF